MYYILDTLCCLAVIGHQLRLMYEILVILPLLQIIRSVLCNIVCNNCAQCNAHTYERT